MANWTKHPHLFGTSWQADDGEGFVLRVGALYLLYAVGHTGHKGYYKTLQEAQEAHG